MASSPGAKFVKKAMSLKTELRDKIIKKQASPLPQSQSSSDGMFSKQHQYNTPVKKVMPSDRLEAGVAKVKQALKYAQDVVQKKTLIMLPGTATVVLETVQELLQTLHYYYHTANSEEYSAQCADLYSATADLMRLSDAHVLRHGQDLETEQILGTIRVIQDTVALLTSHCIEKTEGVPVVTPTSDRSSDASMGFVESSNRSSDAHSEGESVSASTGDSPSPPPSKPPLPKDYELQLSRLEIAPNQRESSPAPPPLPQKQGRARSSTSSGSEFRDVPDHPRPQISFDDADLNQNRTMVTSPSWPGSRSHSREPSPMDILEKMRMEMRNDIGATLTTMRASSSAQKMLQYGIETDSSHREVAVRKEQNMNQVMSDAAQAFNVSGQLAMQNSSPLTTTSVQTYSFQQRIVKTGDSIEQSHSQTTSHVVTKSGRADVNASHVQGYLNEFAGKKDAYVFKVDVEGQDITDKRQGQVKVTTQELSDKMGQGDTIELYGDNPPPLPLKKKHVDIYMLAFGGAPTMLDFAQSQTQFQDFYRERFQKQQSELYNNVEAVYDNARGLDNDDFYLGEPPPKPALLGPIPTIDDQTCIPALDNQPYEAIDVPQHQNEKPIQCETLTEPQLQQHDNHHEDAQSENSIITCTDVWPHITKNDEDGIECVKSGCVDALVALAASASNREFLYQEAFLTTYLTFIHAGDLIDKLLRRYSHFSGSQQAGSKRYCRSTFSLLIRVVDEMGALIGDDVLDDLFYLVFCLISDGELILAKCLRKTVLNKCEMKQKLLEERRNISLLPSIQLTLRTTTLLDLKAHVIAEQMTMIDNELFQNIEISELLRYSREQREELSPNLTKFTEHFNKVSFWCRSRIMEKDDPKEREKFMVKFHKIMKHLRKLKNFHSYLALLAAVDSAPVRRLEWSRAVQDSLTELSDLIDSSSSFKKYRNTLAETQPPCIPYIGLILQDLTFVHIGNPDKTENGEINFSKRWQLFHILEGLRRYKKQCFEIKRDANVIMFFNGFGDHLSEETLWQLSEDYKPRKTSNKHSYTT